TDDCRSPLAAFRLEWKADDGAAEVNLFHPLTQYFGVRLRGGADLEAVEIAPARIAVGDDCRLEVRNRWVSANHVAPAELCLLSRAEGPDPHDASVRALRLPRRP